MSTLKPEAGITEKVTVNMNVVELGYIDLLVSEGYYANRSDFIKAAVRRQLDVNADDIKNVAERRRSMADFYVGVCGFSEKSLERLRHRGEKKRIVVVGMFVLADDIPLALLEDTIESIQVYGVCKCPDEVKKRYML